MDAVVSPRRKAARKRHPSPFVTVLNHAADRLYLSDVRLANELRKDPLRTLHALSAKPESFGDVNPCHDADARREHVSNLLTAARAFVRAERKARVDALDQFDLGL